MHSSLVKYIIGACLLFNVRVQAGGVEGMKEPVIGEILPQQYSEFQKSLGDFGVTDARATIALLTEVKGQLDAVSDSNIKYKTMRDAYQASWRLCLRFWRESHDEAARKLMMDTWNDALRNGSQDRSLQVYALSDVWDRSFLTDDFWQLLRGAQDRKTISAICYVLYKHGNIADAESLMQKRNSGIDPHLQEIVQNAINWMNYRLSGDTENPGPAAAPPRPD